MKKIILLNAPPGAGKDHAAKYIVSNFRGAHLDKFARVLKERTHALYGFANRPWDYYEDCKDIPHKDFMGLTPRQAYIGVSENYFKVMHGERVFGDILAAELDKYEWDLLAISDSGFKPEAEVLIEKYGTENVILIRIHRDGCSFAEDSRSYIDLGKDICTIDIHNSGDMHYSQQMFDVVNSIVNPTPLPEVVPNGTKDTYASEELIDTITQSQPAAISEFDYPEDQPAVPSNTYPKEPIKNDYTEEGEDHIFVDIIEDRPWYKKLWARLVK